MSQTFSAGGTPDHGGPVPAHCLQGVAAQYYRQQLHAAVWLAAAGRRSLNGLPGQL